MSDRGHFNKKKKRFHPQRQYRERNLNNNNNYNYNFYHDNSIETETSTEQEINQTEESDIPGFYYDAEKKKYFKIQKNNYCQQNVVTNDLIKNKIDKIEIEKKAKNQLNKRKNLINFLLTQELGTDRDLYVKFNDNQIINSKLKRLFSLDSSERVKKISLFRNQTTSNELYLLINLIYVPYVYKILKLNEKVFDENNIFLNNDSYSNIRFVNLDQNQQILNYTYEKQSYIPAYIHNDKYLISTYQTTISSDHKPYKLRISELKNNLNNQDYLTNGLYDFEISLKSYKLPLWCSTVNTDLSKCAAGLPRCAEVNNLNDNYSQKLYTKKSDVSCIKFKPNDFNNQIFAGCHNSFLFGYDLRQKTGEFTIELSHKLSVNDILFHRTESNYLYSNDFTGEISLWDLRNPKQRLYYYFDNVECNSRCSIKLNETGDYLYLIPKDGHIRVFNTQTNKLIKTIMSPEPKELTEIYAEIPSIYLIDKLKMIYAVKNRFMYYTI